MKKPMHEVTRERAHAEQQPDAVRTPHDTYEYRWLQDTARGRLEHEHESKRTQTGARRDKKICESHAQKKHVHRDIVQFSTPCCEASREQAQAQRAIKPG
jgi:hypothetical protein